MTWLALLLVGVGLVDLLRAAVPPGSALERVPHEAVAALAAVLLGLLAGVRESVDVAGLVVVAVLVVAWGVALRRTTSPGVAVTVLAGGIALGVLAAPLASPASGAWATWLRASPFDPLAQADPSRALLVAGVLLVQTATGNTLVRLVLAATGTGAPARLPPGETPLLEDPSQRLRGGRLLGPMERLLILGLGLAGQLTAASIVIAAKGLLRWPELSSRAEQEHVHRLTEYFLVGSFVSWLVALGGLVLVV